VTVNKNRRVERSAVNALRTLLEAHDHIVQEIDGANDHGEDLYVTFTERAHRTGDTIAIQVKGGRSFKATSGYRVPVGKHTDFWTKSNVPIVCVVHDPDSGLLHWANASQQLRQAERRGTPLRNIAIKSDGLLDGTHLSLFVRRMRNYISQTAELHRFLTKISGGDFDTTDYLSYFENIHGEQLIFQQRRGEPVAWFLHSDLDWRPEKITPDSLQFGRPDYVDEHKALAELLANLITVGDVIIDQCEAFWLAACFLASDWHREQPPIRPT
jgi:hypothetical protein